MATNPIHGNAEVENGSNSQGVTIDIVDLSYAVVVNNKVKRLLKNVSVSLEAGNMCALMGSSGAGKSTLLDMIADRKLIGFWSGEIYVNGLPRNEYFALRTAYVLQDDIHIATLTVEETLYYSAWTRVPALRTEEQLRERVDTLLKMMGIDHIKNSIVGDPMTKGISGGQMKRLSIAVELVCLPDVIFLDEPTSGLDSSISLEVMGAVKGIIGKTRLCVSTIHQPSPEVFELFDKLVLLSAGRIVYAGNTADAVPYFSSPQLGYTYISGENPAEFIIAVCGGKELPKGIAKVRQPEELEMLFKGSKYFHTTNLQRAKSRKGSVESTVLFEKPETTTFQTQFTMLMSRTWLAQRRDTADIIAQIMKNIVVGLFIGLIFYEAADVSTPFYNHGVQTAQVTGYNSLMFFTMMYTIVGNLQAVPYLCSQNLVYRRELAAHAYTPAPYWICQHTCTVPMQFGFHFLFIIMMYFLTKLPNEGDYFFYYLFITFLCNTTSFYTSLTLAAATGDELIAFAIMPVTFMFVAQFSGYALVISDIPAMWIWAPYLSYGRWAFEGLMANAWDREDTDDANDDYNKNNAGDVLDSYDFDGYTKENSIWILMLFMGFFCICNYFAMLPPKKRLMKMESNDITVSAAQSIADRKSAIIKPNVWNESVGWMKESLIKQDELEGGGDEEQLEYQPRMTADFYRVSTGVMPMAKGCHVVFKNVNYVVTDKMDNTKVSQLLKDVTGQVFPGEMCALMGASGAGKSTLLDVLAHRKNTGQITGTITFNGSDVMKSSAYVMQDNVHVALLTVRESLYFAAQLRLPEEWGMDKKNKRIEKIIDMLGLQAVQNSTVGDSKIRGISGGQVKRLSIGVEIVNLPDVMFLDEPTTGLDSAISFEVISAVRNLANQNRTVIATIHQPSKQTFELFDKVLILARGRVIYFGGNKKENFNEAVDYFANSPYQFYYKPNSNPADYVIAVAGGFIAAADGRSVTGDELADYYERKQKQEPAGFVIDPRKQAVTEQQKPAATLEDEEFDFTTKAYNTSTWHQVKTLVHRSFLKTSRNREATVAGVGRHIGIGIFYGSLYWDLDTGTDQSCYTNRLSVFFFSIIFLILGHQEAMPEFLEERLVFYRERGAKAYGAFTYWISSWFLKVPLNCLNTILYAPIIYGMSGLRDGAEYFGYFFIVLYICTMCGFFAAAFVSSIAESAKTGMSYFPVFMFMQLGFAGYLVYIPEFESWMGNWGPYISFARYTQQGLTLNEFQANDDLPNQKDYIDEMGFCHLSKSQCVGLLFPFLFFFMIAWLVGLKYVDFEKR